MFSKLISGLSKTRDNIFGGINSALSGFKKVDEKVYEDLEEALIMADLGVHTSMELIENLRKRVKEEKISDLEEVKLALKEEIITIMTDQDRQEEKDGDENKKKKIVLVIGVNGVGKTTTIGKLASKYKQAGKTVMLAAGDTFRAAAIDQLKEWANRSESLLVAGAENADPGAVIFDAIASAKAKDVDVLICDTAGRLHNKKNLMNELGKIAKIIDKEYPQAKKEVLLVIDATTGQNAVEQVRQFKQMAEIDGIALTKLDGSAKGGITIAIQSEFNIPIKYIGIGEQIDDLREFNAQEFVDALFINDSE